MLRSLKRNLAAETAAGGGISDRFHDSTLNIDSPRKENFEVLEMSKIIAEEKKKQQQIYKTHFQSKIFVPKESCMANRRKSTVPRKRKSIDKKPINLNLNDSDLTITPPIHKEPQPRTEAPMPFNMTASHLQKKKEIQGIAKLSNELSYPTLKRMHSPIMECFEENSKSYVEL